MSITERSITERYAQLREALRGQQGFRLHPGPGQVIDPPAAVILPAELTWAGPGSAPAEATLRVAAVVVEDDRILERSAELCQRVATLVDALPGFVVRDAVPDRIKSGSTELPCYMINIEVAL